MRGSLGFASGDLRDVDGFDDRQSLGEKETGARAALPMWMDFMRAAMR